MIEILGTQNLKMIQLLGPKFAKKPFFKLFVLPLAPPPILSFRLEFYIIFDYKVQLLSKFRDFRKKYQNDRFLEVSLNV